MFYGQQDTNINDFFRHQSLLCQLLTMAAQIGASALPRPTHYIFRPDGTITLMIAVDELPGNIRISGVPSSIAPADTQGLTSLGVYPRAGSLYIVETMSELPADYSVPEGSEEGEAVESVVNPVENWRRAVAPEVTLTFP